MTTIIAATTAAVSGVSTAFTTTARGFWLYGSKFSLTEFAAIERLGPSGEWETATNDSKPLAVSAFPNTTYIDLPAGTYRIKKSVTVLAASVSWSAE